jgi:heme exporter protein B
MTVKWNGATCASSYEVERPVIENGIVKIKNSAMWAVLQREWRIEWRTRAALNASLLFAIAAPIALSFNLARLKLSAEILAGCLWSVLLFAALVGLSRVFVREEESGTSLQLQLSCSAQAVLWGKAVFNFVLLLLMQLAAVPLFIVLLDAQVMQPWELLLVLITGDIGLALSGTLLGAMASQARARGALFPALAVPILLPLIVSATAATSVALGARGDFWNGTQIIVIYDVILAAAVWMLFDFVWSA